MGYFSVFAFLAFSREALIMVSGVRGFGGRSRFFFRKINFLTLEKMRGPDLGFSGLCSGLLNVPSVFSSRRN